jgi:acid phosphatase family membrane protein YuiD
MDNPYIIVGVATAIVLQTVKMVLKARQGDPDWRNVFQLDGMPDTFSGVIAALCISFLVEGNDGQLNYFLIVSGLVLAARIFWAVRVRQRLRVESPNARESGFLAMVSSTAGRATSPSQVVIGALSGAATAVFLLYSRIAEKTGGLFVTPERREHEVYAVIFAICMLIGLTLLIIVSRGRVRRLPSGKALRRSFRVSLVVPGLLGIALFFIQRSGIQYLDQRIAVWLLFVWIATSLIYFSLTLYDGLSFRIEKDKQELQQEKQIERRKRRSKRTKRRK